MHSANIIDALAVSADTSKPEVSKKTRAKAATAAKTRTCTSETTARTDAYLSSWRQAILDDPKSLMTAFAEAEKAADWVMQRHPIKLEAAAKLASEEQAMEQGLGAHKR